MTTFRDRVASLVALARLRRRGVSFPEVAPTGGVQKRVLIAPANSAGQGYRWARALEESAPGVVVTSMAFLRERNPFAYPIDQAVPSAYAAHSSRWQRAQRDAISTYSAVLIESAQPPFSRLEGLDATAQIELLRDKSIQCALLFHGSDIRDPSDHLAKEADSHFSVDANFRSRMEEVTARSRRVIHETGLPVYVSTPDLLTEVSGAQWLPVVIDVDAWSTETPPLLHTDRPRVVHVPSNARVKGTELVEGHLRRMHDDGLIDYRAVSGIEHRDMPEVYREADIVIDQFRVGNYGVAACEALAAGRIVISHVSDEVRAITRELTGQHLPVIEATHETLVATLTEVIDTPEAALRTARQGPRFVRAWHDGTYSGKVLKTWLEEEA